MAETFRLAFAAETNELQVVIRCWRTAQSRSCATFVGQADRVGVIVEAEVRE